MATTYAPGEVVPKNGTVECTQFHGTRDRIITGEPVCTVRPLG